METQSKQEEIAKESDVKLEEFNKSLETFIENGNIINIRRENIDFTQH